MPPQPRISRGFAKPVRKVNTRSAPAHLALIRLLPCCVCGKVAPSEAHHLMRVVGEARGMALKHADRWAIPLCAGPQGHHQGHRTDCAHGDHGDDEAWLASKGIDGRALATALWSASGDLAAMQRIVFRARQAAA